MATENSGNLTQTLAQGVRGFLIRSALNDQILFRVYDQDHNFVDYEITNYDCEVEIVDPDAALIRNNAGDFLDYTAKSMGIAK
jgi:hypothetical protein